VYLPSYPADLRLQLMQMRARRIDAVALGPGSWSLAPFDQDAELFEGSYHSSNWNHDVDGARSQDFVRTYRARFGYLPIAIAALTYDAIEILIAAVLRADSIESGPLREAIAATRNHEGVTGRLSFDAEGDPVKATAIVQIHGGVPLFRRWMRPTQHP
jgi:branched-chain amino acid transport system substrate-binding protein